MAPFSFEVIHSSNLENAWRGAEKWLLQAAKRHEGGPEVEHYYERAQEKRALLVFVVDSAGQPWGVLLCEKEGNRLNVSLVGGERLIDWLAPAIEWLRDLARLYGKCYVTGGGRPGWERVLANHGFEPGPGGLLRMYVPLERRNRHVDTVTPAGARILASTWR